MSLLGLRTRGDSVSSDKFKWRGADSKFRYGELDKTMYAVTKTKISPEEYHLRPHELFMTDKQWRTVDGSEHSEIDHFLAVSLTPEVWARTERQLQRREAKRNGTDKPLRAWSALRDLLRKETPANPMVLGPVADDPRAGAFQAQTGIGGPLMVEPKAAKGMQATPAGFLAYFGGLGEVRRGGRDKDRLWFECRLALSTADWTLLHRVEPLIVMELGGPKVLCTECSKPAVEPVEPRAWACVDHRPPQ